MVIARVNAPTLKSEETLVLAISVRHRFATSWQANATGRDELRLPLIKSRRVELTLDTEIWSATGAELVPTDDCSIVVRWWFGGGQTASYALLVHGDGAPIDGDRFLDIDSAAGSNKEFDFGRWQFRSQW